MALAIFDKEGEINFCNNAFKDYFSEVSNLSQIKPVLDLFKVDFKKENQTNSAWIELFGEYRYLKSFINITDESFLISIEDHTSQKQLEENLSAHYSILCELREFFIEMNKDFQITKINDSWSRLFPEEIKADSLNFKEIVSDKYWNTLLNNLTQVELTESKIDAKFTLFHNPKIWLEGIIFPLKRNGIFCGFRGVFKDTSDSVIQEKWLEYLAYFDNLTGLPNMFWFEKNLKNILEKHQSFGRKSALFIFDLHEFGQINESLGHKIGDKALIAMAKKLREKFCEKAKGNRIIRWSGDTFILLLSYENYTELKFLIKQIKSFSSETLLVKNTRLVIRHTTGYALFPDDTTEDENLLNLAHKALIYAKKNLPNQLVRCNEILGVDHPLKTLSETLKLENDLSNAFQKEEFVIYYQPKVDARTFKLRSLEAVIRWKHPRKGLILPHQFISIAEDNGMIIDIGYIALKKSIELLEKPDYQAYLVSVNVSKRQLFSAEFVPKLLELIKFSKINRDNLILEITETISTSDSEEIRLRLMELAENGIKLSIDDFGTGYSSLNQLHNMPFSQLKIDRSFVQRLHSRNGKQMIFAIVQIAKAFGLEIVAEGVETIDDILALLPSNIDELQGFVFSPPLSIKELDTWIKNYNPIEFQKLLPTYIK